MLTKEEKKEIVEELLKEIEKPVDVGITLTSSKATLPTQARDGDACLDIYASHDHIISPQRTAIIRTNMKLDIPRGYMVQIVPKSGLAAKRFLTILNSPGTIDAGYKDEVYVIMTNTGIHPYKVKQGEKIAQMRLVKLDIMKLCEGLLNDVKDRGGGLGSTGMR